MTLPQEKSFSLKFTDSSSIFGGTPGFCNTNGLMGQEGEGELEVMGGGNGSYVLQGIVGVVGRREAYQSSLTKLKAPSCSDFDVAQVFGAHCPGTSNTVLLKELSSSPSGI